MIYVLPLLSRTNRWGDRRSEATEDDRIARNVLPHINRMLVTQLAKKNSGSHLPSLEVDLSPRVEAFWFLGGIEPDRLMKKSRKGYKMAEDRINELIDRPMQYTGEPCLSLRHRHPLPQFVERDSGVSIYGNIPEWNADPRTLGYRYKSRHGTNVPGNKNSLL